MLSSVCRSNPCKYGGTCIASLLTSVNGAYQCKCTIGHIGVHCEHRKYSLRIIRRVSHTINSLEDAYLKLSLKIVD